MLPLVQMREKASGRVGGDDEERGAHGPVYGEGSEKREGGDDEEATTDSQEAGQNANAYAGRHREREVRWWWHDRGAIAIPLREDHRSRDDHHEGREEKKEDARGHEVGGLGPKRCGQHSRDAEERGGAKVDPMGPSVDDASHQCSAADDGERHADGRMNVHPSHVDEDRNGQDGASATQQAEREPDQGRECQGDEVVDFHAKRIVRGGRGGGRAAQTARRIERSVSPGAHRVTEPTRCGWGARNAEASAPGSERPRPEGRRFSRRAKVRGPRKRPRGAS